MLSLVAAFLLSTPWDPLIARAHLTPADVQLNPARWRGGGVYALQVFNTAWDDWRKVEPTTLSLATALRDQAASPDKLISVAAKYLDVAVIEPPMPKRLSLYEAIVACGVSDPAGLKVALKAVPADVAATAAAALAPMPVASDLYKRAFAKVPNHENLKALAPEAYAFATDYALGANTLELVDEVDLASLAEASKLLASAAVSLRGKHPSTRPFHFEWSTQLGRIELSGGGDDNHNLDGALLVIDTGGDDHYSGAPTDHIGMTTVIDFGGNDHYQDCGFALLGISEIFDFAGNDFYECKAGGNGAADFGVSVLFDAADTDRYVCRDLGEGAAVCGIGLLLDLEGNDDYWCHCLGEGFAGVKGFGSLVDSKGDDKYTADDTKIDNPSPQTAEHNTSLSQGCGFGRRAHPGDQHSMAGGFGFLVDGAGNDLYKAGVFGEGVGYWYAWGALVDFGGSDSYDGVWYTQGSAAHYSIGTLLDLKGNDKYLARIAQSQGQGHDYSIGLLHDFAGDDSYVSLGSGAFGSGRWNGIGLFADDRGSNTYSISAGAFGESGDCRAGESNFGLFADYGKATYKKPPAFVRPGSFWIQKQETKPANVLGIGFSKSGLVAS